MICLSLWSVRSFYSLSRIHLPAEQSISDLHLLMNLLYNCLKCLFISHEMHFYPFDAAPEEEWNKLLIDGMTVGKGDISPEELYAVIKKRMERTLIRTEGGSYQQRVLIEYLKGIEARAGEIIKVLQG